MRQEEFGAISDAEVYEGVGGGEVIESYPEDRPYPSVLILGRTSSGRPLHLVCAHAQKEDRAIVITVYQPDPTRWTEDFRRRRSE